MMKSFTDRLTSQQIKDFLNQVYPEEESYSFTFYVDSQIYFPHEEKYIYVLVFSRKYHIDWEIVLQSYTASMFNQQWVNYLYKIFRDEYKQAYTEYNLGIFEELK